MSLATWGKIDVMTVHGWKGWLPAIQDQLDIYQRTGQSGRGMQIVGESSEETEIIVEVIYDSVANLKAAVEVVEQWKGRTVVVTDGWGRLFPRVRLNRIKAMPTACKGPGPSGTNAAGKVVFTFLMEVMP